MNKIIEVKDLAFGYDRNTFLKNINFTIYKGEIVGLIGGNGAGKTSLVKLMLGLLQPDSGEILLGGKPPSERCLRIGYVSQKANTFNRSFPASVEEVVLANLYTDIGLFRRPKKKHREQVRWALEQVGLTGFQKQPINELSGGQQQRVFIARALAAKADVLFLDEPTVGVDWQTEAKLYELLKKINREFELTIVLISHDINAVVSNVDRMFCMGAEGFFEHCLDKCCDEDFYRKLYGYEVIPHIHHHTY